MSENTLDAPVTYDEKLLFRAKRLSITHPVLTILVVALFVRLIVVIFVTDYFSGSLVFDDSTYSLMAKQVVAGESHLWDPYTRSLYASTRTFLLPLVSIYRVVGPADAAGQMFVALLGAGTAAITTRLALEYLSTRWSLVAGAVVALLPSQVLWSSLTMKDAGVWLLLALLALAVSLGNRSAGRHLILAGVGVGISLFLLAYLREHTFVVASWAVALSAWAGMRAQRLFRGMGALILAVTIPLLTGFGPLGWTLITNHGDLQQARIENAVGASSAIVDPKKEERDAIAAAQARTIEQAEEVRRLAEDLATRIQFSRLKIKIDELLASIDAQIATLQALQQEEVDRLIRGDEEVGSLAPHVRHLPRGISVMLLEPYPWQGSDSPSFTYAKAETLLWYPILFLASYGAFQIWRYRRVLAFPALAGSGVLITYALTEGNLGTAFRHRGEFVWVVALLCATGLHRLYERRRGRSLLAS